MSDAWASRPELHDPLRGIRDQLETTSGVSLPTIKRLEPGSGPLSTRVDTLEKLTRTLEAAGVIFIPANGEDVGVRLRRERT